MKQERVLTVKEMTDAYCSVNFNRRRAIVEAQAKKLFEWGETVCMEHGMRKRRHCDKCWQQLKKDVGIDSN